MRRQRSPQFSKQLSKIISHRFRVIAVQLGILSGILGQNSTLIFFHENLYIYVEKHALSEFGSTETLAPVITGKITNNREFHGKNTVTSGHLRAQLIFFQKMKFQTFFYLQSKNQRRQLAGTPSKRLLKTSSSKKLVSSGKKYWYQTSYV